MNEAKSKTRFKTIFSSHNLYFVGLAAKALNGLLEIIGAGLVFMSDFTQWSRYAQIIFREELIEDPGDLVANAIINLLQKIDISVQLSGSLYLLSHGLVKLFLVASLLRKKIWAYPLSEIVLALFIFYQTYLYARSGSIFVLFLNGIDLFLMVLIWLEYRRVRLVKKAPQEQENKKTSAR